MSSSIFILVLSVSIVFGIWAWRKFSFVLAASIIVMGSFYLGAQDASFPLHLILSSNSSSSLDFAKVVDVFLWAFVVANVALAAVYFSELVGSWLANSLRGKYIQAPYFDHCDYPAIRSFSMLLGFYLFVALGGMSMMWEILAEPKMTYDTFAIIRRTLIPLGSLLFVSALSIVTLIFVVSLSFDILIVVIRKLVDGPFSKFPAQSLKVCILILFFSTGFYAVSQEFSTVLHRSLSEFVSEAK